MTYHTSILHTGPDTIVYETVLQTIHRFTIGFHNHGEGPWLKATSFLNMVLRDQNVTQLLYISGAFNQEKTRVGASP